MNRSGIPAHQPPDSTRVHHRWSTNTLPTAPISDSQTSLQGSRTQIYPLTLWGARGRNEPAELAAPAALTQKWPALTSLEGTPSYNVGRAYAAFVADIDNGTHTVPDFADAVERHEVIAAIERSAASGERVKA